MFAKRLFNSINKMTFSTSTKPKVLRIGHIKHAHEAWDKLAKMANIIDLPVEEDGSSSYGRAEFIEDLKTNPEFKDIVAISRDLETKRHVGLFDKEIVSLFPKTLGMIITRSAGYDGIDIGELTKKKIQMAHTPDLVSPDTADTNVYLLFAALRNFQYSHDNLMKGNWVKCGGSLGAGTPEGHSPKGKTVGILGNGKIGREILKRLQPFGFKRFIYHNRRQLSPELEGGAEYVSFDELLAESDIISINVPLTASTKHMINKDAIAKMKDNVVIVNTARGAVIDETALIEGLKLGKVFSAGLDVFENEPFGVNQELLAFPNVVSLPHMGTYTVETTKEMEEFVVDNIEQYLKTGKVKTLIPDQKDVEF